MLISMAKKIHRQANVTDFVPDFSGSFWGLAISLPERFFSCRIYPADFVPDFSVFFFV